MHTFKFDKEHQTLEWLLDERDNPQHSTCEQELTKYHTSIIAEYLENPTFKDASDQQNYIAVFAMLSKCGVLGEWGCATNLDKELRKFPAEFFREFIAQYWETRSNQARELIKAFGGENAS